MARLLPFQKHKKFISLKKNLLLSVTLAATAFVLQGCLNDKGEVPKPPETHCDSLNVSYNLNVAPIVQAKCGTIGCHDAGSPNGDLTNYTHLSGISATVANRIQRPSSDPFYMPQGDVLTQDELDFILCWIDKGAPNN